MDVGSWVFVALAVAVCVGVKVFVAVEVGGCVLVALAVAVCVAVNVLVTVGVFVFVGGTEVAV